MSADLPAFTALFDDLRQYGARSGVEVHPSFLTELENYSLHAGVRDLSKTDLEFVLEQIGRRAIDRSAGASDPKAGGQSIRLMIGELCTDPFSDCREAAAGVLEGMGRTLTADDLRRMMVEGRGEEHA